MTFQTTSPTPTHQEAPSMSIRPRTRPDLEARALPMIGKTDEPGHQAAAELGLPYLRMVNGKPTIIRPEAS